MSLIFLGAYAWVCLIPTKDLLYPSVSLPTSLSGGVHSQNNSFPFPLSACTCDFGGGLVSSVSSVEQTGVSTFLDIASEILSLLLLLF